jgi:hypothetical protein
MDQRVEYLPNKHEALNSNSATSKKSFKTSDLNMVVHTYNPSYSGGGVWEKCSLRPA